ncbi:MAG: hydrogenase expression/formation protein HypE [Planctomycetes bacterium]|jgi:hydrogenase expression/formation protein HypE|nr:hydrogenase expression/formation protein HypE [Phycisphaerae bacterium]NBB95226.1 hydrogenase expression/formation protein HypE [Planctomycetota bacterium]
MNNETIMLAHGGGGELTRQLLAERILPKIANPLLDPLGDAAVMPAPGDTLCMTTDSYVVQPLEFPGGDIGRLAICGTVNDLAVEGATPTAISLAMVLEEGLPMATLDRVVDSIAAAGREANVAIVTGDTKVIERQSTSTHPGMTVTTAGLGARRPDARLDATRIAPGDVVICSGRIAEHGLAIMSVREHLSFATELRSDAAPLAELIAAMFDAGCDVKFLRDATRGGLAGVLADLAEDTGQSLDVREADVPLSAAARAAADMLGLDPLSVANEGKIAAVVPAEHAEQALAAMHAQEFGRHAAAIGTFTNATPALVELVTRGGGRRMITRPYGEELPRIC